MNRFASSFKECVGVLNLMGRRKWLYLFGAIGDSASHAALPIIAAFVYIDSFEAAASRDTTLIVKAAVLFCISIVVLSIVAAACKYLSIYMVKASIRELRDSVFGTILKLSVGRHEQTHSGDFVSRMTADHQVVEDLYLNQFKSFFFFVSYCTGSVITMLILEWRIALVLVSITMVSSFFVARFAKSLRLLSDELQKAKGTMTERTIDLLAGLRVIKMFQAEAYMLNRSAEVNERLTVTKKRIGKMTAMMDAVSYFLHIVNYYGVILFGIFMVISGNIGIGIVIAFAQLQFNLSNAFLQLGQFVVQLQGGLAGAARLTELQQTRIESTIQGIPVKEGRASSTDSPATETNLVEFQGTTFSYAEVEPVLKGIHFSIKKGQVAAFVGASGGGKSTIVKLLLGFYEHQEGEILIDQRPIRSYSVADIRNMIAYIPQDAYLFDGTIMENIRYGKPDAGDDEIYAAAKAAIAHDFIVSFPEGYRTQVGERGSKLSGGQKQRIAVARAFLKNAPIVVLDEATSALDAESERLVHASLLRLMQNRTAIIIAHRLSAIEKADIIYVLNNGKIVESGRHEELFASRGAYYGLFQQKNDSHLVETEFVTA